MFKEDVTCSMHDFKHFINSMFFIGGGYDDMYFLGYEYIIN
jgi:hypothetical protein